MTITALPTPPTRQNPALFPADGDAFLGALPVFATEANALAADVTTKQGQAAVSEVNASLYKDDAAASAAAAASSLSAVSAAIGLTVVAVAGTSQAATSGNLYVLQNAALTTVTLPLTPSNGDVISVLVANGRIDNAIARNGKQINGLAQDMDIDNAYVTVLLRYVDATSQWRIS